MTMTRFANNRLRSSLLAIGFIAFLSFGATTESASNPVFDSEHGTIVAETLASGLTQPSALEFLPDGRLLIVQRSLGQITLLDVGTGELTELSGEPKVLTLAECESPEASCGMQDLVLHPDYRDNGWIYISYSEGPHFYSTIVVDRMRLDGTALTDRQRIFTARAHAEDIYHFGGHMAFRDGYLFLTIGDRHHRERAQERDNHVGSILRLHDDGRVPEDNPFAGDDDVLPEIYSYGHRNPYGLAVHPETSELWSHDHGPAHGDELNRIVPGGNYGWPIVSFGWEYDGGPIGRGIRGQDGIEPPVKVWVRGIAPSDLVIYRGDLLPEWRGSFLIGSLSRVHLNRLRLENGQVAVEERIMTGAAGRVRSIAVDSSGAVYLGSDSGTIVRLSPEK